MPSTRTFVLLLAAWGGLALLAPAGPARALTYTLQSGSSLSADLSAAFSVTVDVSNAPDPSGPGSVSGPLSSVPVGTVGVAVDTPPTTLSKSYADIDAPNPGTATGSAALDVLGIFTLNTAVQIDIHNISLDLEAPTSAALTATGPGAWSFTGMPGLLIGATASGTASTSILGIPVGFSVPAFTFGGNPPGVVVPIDGTLQNLPGGGSQLAFAGSGFDVMVPVSGMATTVQVNECINSLFGACLNEVRSVTLTIESVTFSNVMADIVATSPQAILPEPGSLALAATAAAGLVACARRRRGGQAPWRSSR